MAHEYDTILILAAVALVAITLVLDFWIAHLRSRHEALLRTPVPSRALHVRGFGRSPQDKTALRATEEAQRLEATRRNLESQLGQTLHAKGSKGPAFVKR